MKPDFLELLICPDCDTPNHRWRIGNTFDLCSPKYASYFDHCLLIIQVPHLRSIQSRWARQEEVPRHLYSFSERTLRAYGNRIGLVLDKIVHSTDLFVGSGRG